MMNEADCGTIIQAAVDPSDESIYLVSQERAKFAVNKQLARRCSPYIDGLLRSGMREAGEFAMCTNVHKSYDLLASWATLLHLK